MGEEIESAVEGRLGVIALNRPAAINALSLGMVRAIAAQLTAWRDDDRVRAVLFEGRGPKGFCAGGDVRWVREQVIAGRPETGFQFFADEYAMDGMIADYDKPVVALCDGVVMGGGIGIAGHADFRFATAAARFAMPESAIGFVCDVGVNAILARAPLHRALLFLLTGLAARAADALALGLTDCVIPGERIGEVRGAIVAAAGSQSPDVALVELMQSEGVEAGAPELCAVADLLAEELGLANAAEIAAAISRAAARDSGFGEAADALATRCPASLEAIHQGHLAARRLGDLGAVLALDIVLARFMAGRPDFAEGVRAVLIDRDGRAKWGSELPRDEIAGLIAEVVRDRPRVGA